MISARNIDLKHYTDISGQRLVKLLLCEEKRFVSSQNIFFPCVLIHIQTIEINLLETYMIKYFPVNIIVWKVENKFSKIF